MRKYIGRMLGSEGMKVIIFDEETIQIMAVVVGRGELRGKEVYAHRLLSKRCVAAATSPLKYLHSVRCYAGMRVVRAQSKRKKNGLPQRGCLRAADVGQPHAAGSRTSGPVVQQVPPLLHKRAAAALSRRKGALQ